MIELTDAAPTGRTPTPTGPDPQATRAERAYELAIEFAAFRSPTLADQLLADARTGRPAPATRDAVRTGLDELETMLTTVEAQAASLPRGTERWFQSLEVGAGLAGVAATRAALVGDVERATQHARRVADAGAELTVHLPRGVASPARIEALTETVVDTYAHASSAFPDDHDRAAFLTALREPISARDDVLHAVAERLADAGAGPAATALVEDVLRAEPDGNNVSRARWALGAHIRVYVEATRDPDPLSRTLASEGNDLRNGALAAADPGRRERMNAAASTRYARAIEHAIQAGNLGRATHAELVLGQILIDLGDARAARTSFDAAIRSGQRLLEQPEGTREYGAYSRTEIEEIARDAQRGLERLGLDLTAVPAPPVIDAAAFDHRLPDDTGSRAPAASTAADLGPDAMRQAELAATQGRPDRAAVFALDAAQAYWETGTADKWAGAMAQATTWARQSGNERLITAVDRRLHAPARGLDAPAPTPANPAIGR